MKKEQMPEQKLNSDSADDIKQVSPLAQNRMLAEVPVKVKLLTLWMRDKEYPLSKPCDHMISFGIWETRSVFYKDNHRAYELVCVMPMHNKLKIGDTRRMYEDVILALCHPVQITHLPKIVR